MYLVQNYSKKTKRTYLQIVHGYRDQNGKSKRKVIASLGYLDELKKEIDDPVAHYKMVAKEMEAERLENTNYVVTLSADSRLEKGVTYRKNFGHVVFNMIYHELELDRFFNNKRRHENFKFNSNSIMKLLLFARLIYPCSKKRTFEIKDLFFDKTDFSLDDIYNCLTHFDKIEEEAQQFIHEQVVKQYNRNTDLIYYDVTNYYFEIDQNDEFRKKGACKSHTPNPIIQMGLAMDNQGFPISYKLFEGNTHDSQTLMKILSNIKSKFNTKRVIVVADKGLNSGDNIAFNTALGDGYIYGQKVKGTSKEFQEYVLDQKGYRWVGTDEKFKIKSRVIPTTINVTVGKTKNGRNKKKKVPIDQKQIIFYSKKYAERSKKKRDETLRKAADMIANPSKYSKATNYGAANYVLNIEFDKETGEYKENGKILSLDEEKIKQEEKLDGYYSIISSELDETDEHIVEHYHGLWKIEESFKVTKSYLDARPIFLTTEEHINAHFFICFVALLFTRIVEKRLGNKHSIENILYSLRNTTCSHLDANLFIFDYLDDVSEDINKAFNLDIGKKAMTLKEIKNIFARAKKR